MNYNFCSDSRIAARMGLYVIYTCHWTVRLLLLIYFCAAFCVVLGILKRRLNYKLSCFFLNDLIIFLCGAKGKPCLYRGVLAFKGVEF